MRECWIKYERAKTCNHHWVDIEPYPGLENEPRVMCTECDTVTQGTRTMTAPNQAVADARIRWAVKRMRSLLSCLTNQQLAHAWANTLENATDRAEYNQAEFIEAEMTVRGLDTPMT